MAADWFNQYTVLTGDFVYKLYFVKSHNATAESSNINLQHPLAALTALNI